MGFPGIAADRLYAITDRTLLPGEHARGRLSDDERDGLLQLVDGWNAAEIGYVQLREKDLALPELAALTRAIRSVLSAKVRLLVNVGAIGATDAMLTAVRDAGAAGVHLPGRWQAEEASRARMTGVVSVGCHSVGEVAVARTAGADIALLSPVFTTESHPEAPALGLETLAAACRTAVCGNKPAIPVFALGGITAANADACLAVGAAGVAGIRTFLGLPTAANVA